MAVIKWDPWRDIEGLFDRYTKTPGWPQTRGQDVVASGDWTPRVDISETDQHFLIKMEAPEVRKEDLRLTVENGVLTISGKRKQEKEEKGVKYHRIERHYGSFSRSFTLPDNVDAAEIKAAFSEGLLNIEIRKTEEKRPSAIQIDVE